MVDDDEEVVGRISLRHTLTPWLLEVGGHIGYAVRPTARRRGHATTALGLMLRVAAERGIDPVLVTCDDDNVGSRRVIEANGGVLEDVRNRKMRFWLPSAVRSTALRQVTAFGGYAGAGAPRAPSPRPAAARRRTRRRA